MKIQIEDTEWQALQDRVARMEALLPARLVGGSDFALVMSAVEKVFGVPPRVVCSPRRTDEAACARMCAAWLLRTHCDKTLYQIRDMMRRRNHSFLVHSLREAAVRRSVDAKFDAQCTAAERLLCEHIKPCLKAA